LIVIETGLGSRTPCIYFCLFQGIIHRDLKPFNIFLDSKDRIKIGDFGLATSHASVKENPEAYVKVLHDPAATSSDKMTGKVGTALYVAPELSVARSKVKFSQKVDMYSLGVILFEMCYRPLTTGMERVKTIGMIRSVCFCVRSFSHFSHLRGLVYQSKKKSS